MEKGYQSTGQDDFVHKNEAEFVAKKNLIYLFKGFLKELEGLRTEHQINFTKLRDSLPVEYKSLIDMADYFDEKKFAYLRKSVLDMGNESVRRTSSDIQNL